MLKLTQGKTEFHASNICPISSLSQGPLLSQKRKKQKENITLENRFKKKKLIIFSHFKKFRNKFQFRSIIQHLARLA